MTPKHEATDAMGMSEENAQNPLSGKSGELKPCPFCGSQPSRSDEFGRVLVFCVNATCDVSPRCESFGNTGAVAAWNRRATTQPAEQSPVEGEYDERLKWFLTIVASGRGGVVPAGDGLSLVDAFCDDRGHEDDTYNVSESAGWTRTTHSGWGDGDANVAITDAGRAKLSELEALTTRSVAVSSEAVGLMCAVCRAPRKSAPCHKCGGELTAPAEGWDWPELPDIEKIRSLAREKGYGLGVHGSLERDLDLIAAPWVEECATPFELASHIANGIDGRIAATFCDAPHGRIGFNIQQNGWFKLIDLSVMSPALNQARKPEGAEPVGWASQWVGQDGQTATCLHTDKHEAHDNAKWMEGRSFAVYAHPAHEAGETWQSISAWALETFGPATAGSIVSRANREMRELLADPSDVKEAADTIIVLCQYPGVTKAIDEVMARNRSRRWKLNGDGTGQHIPDDEARAALEDKAQGAQQ